MLARPARYKKFEQQTFENNCDRFKTNLDPFIDVLQRHLAVISSGGRATQGLSTEHHSAGELLVFSHVIKIKSKA